MPASNVAAEKRSQPQILVETAGLSEEEWLAYRRKGIGGSDVAALLGISPWRTARDLYFDKLNIVAVEDNEDNCSPRSRLHRKQRRRFISFSARPAWTS